MSEETPQGMVATQRETGEVTDPAEISKMLGELAERNELLFFSETGADVFFVANAVALDAQRRTLRVTVTSGSEDGPDIPIGGEYDVFVPLLKADLLFAAAVVETTVGADNTFDLAMPSRLRLGCRREDLRGSCFGLVEVLMRRKEQAQGQALRASLNDISNGGCGIFLPAGLAPTVRPGDRFDDCVLLLNSKPMAMCTIDVLHTRREPETGDLRAGGRFTDLTQVARHRIAQLISTLDPLSPDLPSATTD